MTRERLINGVMHGMKCEEKRTVRDNQPQKALQSDINPYGTG